MQRFNCFAIVLIVAILAACGPDVPPGSPAAGPDTPAGPSGTTSGPANPRVAATAAEVAREARGNIQCPAKISSAPRAADAPVDDIVGVRPGLSFEEAADIVLCTNELLFIAGPNTRGFQINTYGQTLRQGFSANLAEDRINKTSKEIMQEMQDRTVSSAANRRMNRDDMRGKVWWYVGTMGMPNKERVFSVAREEWYAEGRQPTTDSVQQALLDKYGKPTQLQRSGGSGPGAGSSFSIKWAYDPLGRLITETSPLASQCYADANPGGRINLSPDCGLVVVAQVVALQENPALAETLRVALVDQANGYEAVAATEQAFEAQEQQRRTREAQDAAKNADAPVL